MYNTPIFPFLTAFRRLQLYMCLLSLRRGRIFVFLSCVGSACKDGSYDAYLKVKLEKAVAEKARVIVVNGTGERMEITDWILFSQGSITIPGMIRCT